MRARLNDQWDAAIVAIADAILDQAPHRSVLDRVVSSDHQRFREMVCDQLEGMTGKQIRAIALEVGAP